jgi:hypothetical protein
MNMPWPDSTLPAAARLSSRERLPAGRETAPMAWRPVVGVIMAIASCWLSADMAAAQAASEKVSRGFLEKHCLRCHDGKTQEGEFRLDTLANDFADPQVAEKWSEVRFRINAGEMPPPEEPQPTADEIGMIADFITTKIREGAAARMARRGTLEHYRLSRPEYAHTVYDLLGVVFDVEAPGRFNEDPRWHGFDRIGSLLSVAPSHVDRYFNAADTVVELAFPDEDQPPKTTRKSAGEGMRRLLQLGEGEFPFKLDKPGRYRIKVHASGLPAFSGRVPRLAVWHDLHKRSFGGVDLVAAEDQPTTIVLEGLFPEGSYQIRNHARTQSHANGGVILFRNELIGAAQRVATLKNGYASFRTKVVDEEGRPAMPLLLVDWIEIEGPLVTEADRACRDGVFPIDAANPEELQACLRRFAERAWRRPVTDAELQPYVRLIATEQQAGEPFRAAYKTALANMLVARSFFNLEEGSPNENRKRLNDHELASRLSYFLWSSLPDKELFTAARDGQLHTSATLAKEMERMMADPKIERFLDSFPRQWLQLHRLGMFQPDPNLYPDYDPWLQESMVAETTAYFAEMFRSNLPLREAVDSNWTMLNSRLASHYGLPKPQQAQLARAEVRPESGRGGMLTHAAVLSLTSDGTRHRPVHRGAWVSEAIFARTPPPPPPNVGGLEPVKDDQPKTTIRSQLKAHASSATCASCHAKIDPLGLAFENYDAIGRWREKERIEGGIGDDPPVDASGIMPDGKAFAGPREFKQLLAANDDRLAEAFLEQLATYALRRVMTIDDLEQLHVVAAAAKADGYRVQSLIRGLVMSELFQQR